MDGSGTLSKSEVIEVLRAQLPVDERKLQALLDQNWSKWDLDGNGTVEMMEMIQPQTGLLAFVKHHREELLKERRGQPPDIRDDPSGWFDYWDEDHSQSLDQDEVVRGLIKTFGLSDNESVSIMLQKIVCAIWNVFDEDKSGAIDRDEFLKPKEGLGASLVASLQ